jgi:Putative peptidoglycan binding domain
MKLAELLFISVPTPISELTGEQLKELQKALSLLGYPIGEIDGLIGPKTRNAWSEFKTDVFLGNPGLIGRGSIEMLQGKLDNIGKGKAHDFSNKSGTIEAIKWECRAQGVGLNTQISYVLATTQWETNQTFEPVREAYWLSENWRKKNLRYYPFYGRGFVQLTWKNNYEKYSRILDVDMVGDPDIAMQPSVALFVLVHGFKTGTFTGRKITDYIDDTKTDFVRARRCINGTDKAHEIADIAKKLLADL